MASVKPFSLFFSLYFLLFLSPLSLPFSYSSPTLLQSRKAAAINTAYLAVIQVNKEVAREGKGSAAFPATAGGGDSARQVPTGPDPLHHNDNPASP